MTGSRSERRGKFPARAEEVTRRRITAEAARIMAEEGVRDFQAAKRKAAQRLGLSDHRHLPGNDEIESALNEHLQLFHRQTLAKNTKRHRQIAADAMLFLARFEPRAVGSVLSGTITPNSEIQLHISADAPEQVELFLQEQRIPYEIGSRRVRFGGERNENVTTFRFSADGEMIELCVFDPRRARETPLSPVDGQPMRRANRKEIEALIQTPDAD